MFRSSNRSLIKKLLERRTQSRKCIGTPSEGTKGYNVACRYMSQGAVSSFEGSYAKRFPPLFCPLPGLKPPSSVPDFVERNPARITTLPNGLRIASENAVGPAACIGIFVDSGSIYESEEFTGATHLLERLAFKSTKNRSHLQIVHDVETIGGHLLTSALRDQTAYSCETLKTYLPEAVELLIDCIKNPLFVDSEVEEQLINMKREIGEATNDPQRFLLESLHRTGFSGALGNPLIAPESALEKLNGPAIRKFYHKNYTADRLVLAAYGVDHEQLVNIAEPLLYDLNRGPPLEAAKSTYTGGDYRHKVDSEMTHVALGFEVPGGWHNEKDATALTVLQTLMGGGGSFSTGGPGKGMHSRLYLRVLNVHQAVDTFSAFSSIFNHTGLFGIFSTTGSDFAAKAVDIATGEMLLVATPGQVTQEELDRAKNATKSLLLFTLESRGIITEDIGRQILTFGCRKPMEHFLKYLDELTLDDITAVAQKMLSSPVTMACLGNVDKVPDYDSVSRRFLVPN